MAKDDAREREAGGDGVAQGESITAEIQGAIINPQMEAVKTWLQGEQDEEKRKQELAKLKEKGVAAYLQQHTTAADNTELQSALREVEKAGYQKLVASQSFKPIVWQQETEAGKGHIRKIEIPGNDGAFLTETTMPAITINGQKVDSYRSIDFPASINSGPRHFSMAVKGSNGQNIQESEAVYFTAHYDKDGKLQEISSPIPVKFAGNDKDAIGYIEKVGSSKGKF